MIRTLDVYFHESPAGKLHFDNEGKLDFVYLDTYLEQKNASPLSVSMPLAAKSFTDKITRAFFSGLLPDEFARHQLARCLGVSEKNPFALLKMIGGECAGAIALYPEDHPPEKHSYAQNTEVLSEKRLTEIIALLAKNPLLVGEKDLRLSLAGAQNKLAVGWVNNKILLIKNGAPTSHILKPLIHGIEDSVQNEFFCMLLAAKMKLPVADVNFDIVNDMPFLLVTRYDRIQIDPQNITRLHQEDFCQALSIPPELKYESEGGPSIRDCFSLIRNYSKQPAVDLLNLLRIVIFNYLIGNGDAHGKNFSLLYTKNGLQIAPFYDLMSTQIYSQLSNKMAMKVGGEYQFNDIYLRNWERFALQVEISPKLVLKTLHNLYRDLLPMATDLAKELNSNRCASPIYSQIVNIIHLHGQNLI